MYMRSGFIFQISTIAAGKPWSIETSSARNHQPFNAGSTAGMKTSASYPRMGHSDQMAGGSSGGGGGYQDSLSR